MIEADQIEAISAADVRSSDDDKVGSVGQVFLDPQTGRPEWAAVKTGIFGTKGAFVPLRNAEWDGRVVRLAYDKERVRNAPHIDPDDRGLDPDQQVELYTYYGFTEATPPSAGSAYGRSTTTSAAAGSAYGDRPTTSLDDGRADDAVPPSTASQPVAETVTPPLSLSETARTAMSQPGPAADAPEEPATSMSGLTPAVSLSDTANAAITAAATQDTAATTVPSIDASRESDADDGATMTRMEEHLQVSVEPQATERVRLRKHVVTTQETVTVTIRREELRIERVPIGADEARGMGSGPGIGDSETEIVLYEERPVVTTVARPVERIRLTREVVASEEQVTADVRKERIEVEDGAIG